MEETSIYSGITKNYITMQQLCDCKLIHVANFRFSPWIF